jgi:hypothetical protein
MAYSPLFLKFGIELFLEKDFLGMTELLGQRPKIKIRIEEQKGC